MRASIKTKYVRSFFLHAINYNKWIIFRVMALQISLSKIMRGTEHDRRCVQVFREKQTSLSTRAVIGAVIASFIWFPAYQGERQAKKIYINIDIDRRGARGAGKAGRGGATQRATIYRYTRLIISGSYLGILARDKSLNGRIPAKRDGTRNGQYVWNITASMKISRDKSGCALFRDLRVAEIHELASQCDEGNHHSSINYIVFLRALKLSSRFIINVAE